MILGIPQADPLRYLNRQKMRKRYMIFMKISNKVLSQMVFSHRRVCYNARCKNVEKTKTKQQQHFIQLHWQNVKQQQQQKKT